MFRVGGKGSLHPNMTLPGQRAPCDRNLDYSCPAPVPPQHFIGNRRVRTKYDYPTAGNQVAVCALYKVALSAWGLDLVHRGPTPSDAETRSVRCGNQSFLAKHPSVPADNALPFALHLPRKEPVLPVEQQLLLATFIAVQSNRRGGMTNLGLVAASRGGPA